MQNLNTKSAAALALAGILLLSFVPLGNSFANAAVPVLSVSVSANKGTVAPGDEVTYTITYRNSGTATATGVVIKDSFSNIDPSYFDFVSANPAPDSGNNTWVLDTPLAYNETGKIVFTIKLKSALPSNWIGINNQVSIDSNETNLQYSNYATIYALGSCVLTLSQTVRNVSNNSSFATTIDADPNDEIEFSLELKSTGTNQAVNTKIWEALSVYLDYTEGSTTVNGSALSDGIIGSGVSLGNLLSGTTETIKFRAKVLNTASSYVGQSVLRNFGYANAQSCGLSSSPTSISVAGRTTDLSTPTLISATTGITGFQVLARNLSRKSVYLGDWADVVYAQPGDEIEFLIRIKSATNKIVTARVADNLPPKMFYESDSTTVDGNYQSDGITTKNIYLNEIYPNLYREIKFRVRLASADDFNFYPISLVNQGVYWNEQGKDFTDSAKIIVNSPSSQVLGVSIVSGSSLSLIKTGRDITKNQVGFTDSFFANPSDQLEFYVQVTNNGTVDVNNVRVWDNLPQNISIISGSTTIDGANWGGDITGSGLNLGTVKKGITKNIKFKAEVAAADKFTSGSINLTNNVFVEADGIFQISDKVTVAVNAPGEVKGAATIKTGFDYLMVIILSLISAIVAFVIYCILREEKLLEDLKNGRNGKFYRLMINLYFRAKLILKIGTQKVKRIRS